MPHTEAASRSTPAMECSELHGMRSARGADLPEKGVVGAQLVPAHHELGLGVAEEAAHIGACGGRQLITHHQSSGGHPST
jgi:hypothetical protein